jgi:hypothetical protein
MLLKGEDIRLHFDAIFSAESIQTYCEKYKEIDGDYKELLVDSIKFHLYVIINSSRKISTEHKLLFPNIDWKWMSLWESGSVFDWIPDDDIFDFIDQEEFIKEFIASTNKLEDIINEMPNSVFLCVEDFVSYLNNDGGFLANIWIKMINSSRTNPLTIKQIKPNKLTQHISSNYKCNELNQYLMSDLLVSLENFEFASKILKPKVIPKKKKKVKGYNYEYNDFIETLVGIEKQNESNEKEIKLRFRTNSSIWTVKKR